MSLLSLLFLVACEPPPPPVPGAIDRTGEVLSTVNGQAITQPMVDARIAQLPADVRDKLVAQGQTGKVSEELQIGELLYQEALKAKLHEDGVVKVQMALAERSALANALMEKVIKERTTDAAVAAWYDEHKVQYARPQVKARHILLKDAAAADGVLAEVKGGADFSAVAKAKSEDKGSKETGGDLGWFDRKRMIPAFADAAFAAEKGQIVGPVQTQFGYHIILVDDKRDAIPLEEAAEGIKTQLKNDIIEKYIEELKKGATITQGAGGAAGATVSTGAASPGAAPAAGGTAPAGAHPAGAPPAKDK